MGDNADLKTEASRVKETAPDAVVFTNYAHMDVGAKRLKELGVSVPFFAILLDDRSVQLADGALEGTVFVTFNSPTQEFINKFKKEYGRVPRVSADTSYDALNLLAEAIERAGNTDIAKVQAELSGIREWNGASGVFSLDQYGVAGKRPSFYRVENFKIVPFY